MTGLKGYDGMVAIIDYDAGNIKSVEKALVYLGQEVRITRDYDEIMASSHVILPGVGCFGDAMQKLRKYRMDKAIYEVVQKKIPFLGICLGLQLLYENSEESPGITGLGILKGNICKIPKQDGLKIPHMGWNSLNIKPEAKLFAGLSQSPYVYFVHSYYLQAEDISEVSATTEYAVHIHASVERENIFACQFHPEKSSTVGLKMLKNFVNL